MKRSDKIMVMGLVSTGITIVSWFLERKLIDEQNEDLLDQVDARINKMLEQKGGDEETEEE